MKIAIFTDSFKPNTDGVATITEIMAKELVKLKHQVTIVCPNETTEILKENGYKIICLKSQNIKLYREQKICLKTPEYLEQLEDFSKYDLIHLQTNVTLGSIGFLVALKFNKPLSCTFHTNIADFATSFFDESLLKNNKNPIYKIMGRNKFLLSLMKKFTYNIMWKFARDFHNAVPSTSVPSRFCRALLRSKGVKNPIFVLPNPVNPSNSNKNYFKKYPIKNSFNILHVGRLSVEKRVHLIIEAIAIAKKSIPNIKGIICSDGPTRKHLEKLAKKRRVMKNIIFTGFISRDELNFLYEQSHIVTGFGLFETFNLCATEGLYYSKPLLLSDAGPHSELIDKNGFIVPIEEREEDVFAKHIVDLFENKKLYTRFAKQSKKMWKRYNYDKSVASTIKYMINAVEKNHISFKNYMNYIKYISSLGIMINTLTFTLSLKFKQIDKLQKRFDNFFKNLSDAASKFRKSF